MYCDGIPLIAPMLIEFVVTPRFMLFCESPGCDSWLELVTNAYATYTVLDGAVAPVKLPAGDVCCANIALDVGLLLAGLYEDKDASTLAESYTRTFTPGYGSAVFSCMFVTLANAVPA